jgi:uncharacterized protein
VLIPPIDGRLKRLTFVPEAGAVNLAAALGRSAPSSRAVDPTGRPTVTLRLAHPMPRRPLDATRGVLEIDWSLFGELCRALALKVAREYDPECVVGIAKAGVIPGAVVASILEREFASMTVTRRTVGAMPVLVSGPPATLGGRRVLLVDETCDSGHTLKLALNEIKALDPAEVRTAVSFKTGSYRPDFFSFETDKAIILPWDREIIRDGALIRRPDWTPGS